MASMIQKSNLNVYHVLNMLFIFEVMFQISAAFLFLFDNILAKNITAIFVFGDSMVDVGNNNYIKTIAKAAFPNGIDFGLREQNLGAKNFTPPYLAPTTTGDMVLKGVNYASSGSGILKNSGIVWGGHISLDEQISNFEKTKKTIVSRIGRREAKRLLMHQALFMVVTGANDFLIGQQVTSLQNPSSQGAYLNILTSKFKSQLTRIYHLEARKIVVTNIPRIGCSPYERDAYPDVKGCVASLNQPIKSYNSRLKSLLMDLTANLTGSTYVYADIHAMLEDILKNYKSYGQMDNGKCRCCLPFDFWLGGEGWMQPL
ncbi:GDSL esterase/lipase At4g16230-like [Herrania umbratica]|uniref:GDSL esterase/lipase At4g16230-like n=1 Tax=Herrania umbratica TaxID=108875 RepID=A0A6J1AZ42_9ROSI|nr:GDSL esterase/lipase At4g16230-like [Herrania umbratica]